MQNGSWKIVSAICAMVIILIAIITGATSYGSVTQRITESENEITRLQKSIQKVDERMDSSIEKMGERVQEIQINVARLCERAGIQTGESK